MIIIGSIIAGLKAAFGLRKVGNSFTASLSPTHWSQIMATRPGHSSRVLKNSGGLNLRSHYRPQVPVLSLETQLERN